ncbi:phosphatidylglycerophosphatase A family protein [Parvibaculum lavamentivorans]|uniref:phosphatidylglycerophosphatase A family protein n=1 Tax=Parvibaculum lavamentivorans TaxID=256618 RepID=UPI00030795E9|nr:phosphatidylglycerophosphatase A [Parvibaculum lavamentivorans]
MATCFGAGLLRPAPGTWGTLAAFPFAFVISWAGGPWLLLLASGIAFAAGLWAAGVYCNAALKDDAAEVVIDEVAAVWLVLAALPMTPVAWTLGFFLFRTFDILKPWPISAVERRFKGGFGVMIDDIIAAILAVFAFILMDVLWMVVT